LANQLLTIGMITKETLIVLVNETSFTKRIKREYDSHFGVDGAKIGMSINLRKPIRPIAVVGQALQLQDAVETFVPLVLNSQVHVDMAFTSQELGLFIDEFSDRFLRPSIAQISNRVDADGLLQYLNLFNEVGVPGTIPNSDLTYLQAAQRLDEMSVPRDGQRFVAYSPAMNTSLVDALKGLFQKSDLIAEQYAKGEMGTSFGLDFAMDQNVRTQTVGLQGGTPTVNGANQTGAAIITQAWSNTTAILNIGDVVSFAGVFAVNPQSRASTGALAQWVITAPVTSSGGGAATLPISGPDGNGIIIAGQFQNASNSPANGAAVTVQGASAVSSPRGICFHPDAFAFVCADLPLYGGLDMGDRAASRELGVSVRIIRMYDINLDRAPLRADILYGWGTKYPQLGVRIAS
jgi:P22 coat protein - gene protein 5